MNSYIYEVQFQTNVKAVACIIVCMMMTQAYYRNDSEVVKNINVSIIWLGPSVVSYEIKGYL